MVRTRFAPSPTGELHVGNARVAVLNWLFARRHQGEFVLRIEDTDRERNIAGAEAGILEDLVWLGLDWDEGPGIEGPHGEGPYGPYRQSERLPLYRDAAQRLVEAGIAFRCYCTADEIEARREAAIARGRPAHYDGACRRLTAKEMARFERQGRRAAIRFHVPDEAAVVVRDMARGEIRFGGTDIGDFIILRSDGLPTYNFAVVADDAAMRITHVIRGAGHLSNAPRQVLLYAALGREPPVFVHVPTVLGADRQKLSKRNGARPLSDYRREGYHPDALVNYLSLLSWSSASGDELLVRNRLINEVLLERVGTADVVFDPDKLRWLSAKHVEAMPVPALVEAVSPYVDRERFPLPDETLPVAIAAVRTHLSTFAEINEQLDVFVPMLDDEAIAARAALREDPAAQAVLRVARESLAQAATWEESTLHDAIRHAGRVAGVRGRALYEPLRIALTGRPHGPPFTALLYVLGRSSVLRLLDEALVR